MKICFQREIEIERRGESLPGCSRFSAKSGVTLVELMISFLILTIVCLSWFEILSIQSAKREALRREGVERLAGMMETFAASINMEGKIESSNVEIGEYIFEATNVIRGVGYAFTKQTKENSIDELFDPVMDGGAYSSAACPGYRLYVKKLKDIKEIMDYNILSQGGMLKSLAKQQKVLVGELFKKAGVLDADVIENDRICRFVLLLGQ
jgi:hypothetical protein